MSLQAVATACLKYQRFVIAAYERLDGDSVGCELAMYHLLKRMGKDVVVANLETIPERYQFLEGSDRILVGYDQVPRDRDCMITVDCPDVTRADILQGYFPPTLCIVNIDHHGSNYVYGDVNWIDANAAAVGVMIFALVKELRQPLTREIATALYVSIVTDTGRFGFDKTNALVHRVVADLHDAGIDLQKITREVYQSYNLGEYKLLGRAAASLQLYVDGRLAVVTLTSADLDASQYSPEESQPFVEIGLAIKNVEMAIFQRPHKKSEKIKFSLRSKNPCIDVNQFASQFGGGGHPRAAGISLTGDFAALCDKLLQAASAFVRACPIVADE